MRNAPNVLLRIGLLLFALSVTPRWNALLAQAGKDTLFLRNGSVIVGKLKKIRMGVITFDPDDANDITVQLRKAGTLRATSDVFRIETVHREALFGHLAPDSVGHVTLDQWSARPRLALEDIQNLYPFGRSFMQRFSGNVGMGYSFSKSSGLGQMNLDGALNYLSRKQEIRTNASGMYSHTDSVFQRDREEFSLKANYYFSPTSFTTVLLTYQRNLELGLHRRYQEGFGVGNKFITSRMVYAWGRTGIMLNQEKSTQNQLSGTLVEGFLQFQFNFFRYAKPEVSMDLTETFYVGMTEKGRIRNDGEVNLNWEIIGDLRLSLSLYTNYDSRTAVTNGPRMDFAVVTGLKYVF